MRLRCTSRLPSFAPGHRSLHASRNQVTAGTRKSTHNSEQEVSISRKTSFRAEISGLIDHQSPLDTLVTSHTRSRRVSRALMRCRGFPNAHQVSRWTAVSHAYTRRTTTSRHLHTNHPAFATDTHEASQRFLHRHFTAPH